VGEGVSVSLKFAWQCFACLLLFNKNEQCLNVSSAVKSALSPYEKLKLKADREASEVLYWLEDTPLFEAVEKAQLARRFLV